MKAMILAAGEGQRFRPYTERLPKPALPFCGYPLLYYSLFQLHQLSISKLVINTFHLPEKISGLTENLPTHNIELSNEKPLGKLQGSGGGIALAQKSLIGNESFLVLNSDEVILPVDTDFMKKFVNTFTQINPLACLLTTTHPEAGKKFGAVWVDDQNQVWGFGKSTPANGQNLKPMHFLGTQILNSKIFQYLQIGVESNILYDVLTPAISKGDKVYAYSIDCHWHETGNLADFLLATKYCLDLIESNFPYLNNFYSLLGNEYLLVKTPSGLNLAHRSAQISQDAEISGFLVAGKNSIVERGVKLKNTIINQNFKAHSNMSFSDTICIE
jgi:mannose-1-phosphate guanylyltransferase